MDRMSGIQNKEELENEFELAKLDHQNKEER